MQVSGEKHCTAHRPINEALHAAPPLASLLYHVVPFSSAPPSFSLSRSSSFPFPSSLVLLLRSISKRDRSELSGQLAMKSKMRPSQSFYAQYKRKAGLLRASREMFVSCFNVTRSPELAWKSSRSESIMQRKWCKP